MPEHLEPWNTPVMHAWSCIVLWMAHAITMLCQCVCGVCGGCTCAHVPRNAPRAPTQHTCANRKRGACRQAGGLPIGRHAVPTTTTTTTHPPSSTRG